jgi:large subunit ribosomal protein L23
MMKAIIKKPIISEKATGASEKFNRFTFAVDKKANKIEIKNAVEKMYGVSITDVRTMAVENPLLNILTKVSLSNQVNNGKKLLLLLQ